MNRNQLISEVKNEYSLLASAENSQATVQSVTNVSPDAYYEKLLDKVVGKISDGGFDGYKTGKDIVEAVAKDKSLLL